MSSIILYYQRINTFDGGWDVRHPILKLLTNLADFSSGPQSGPQRVACGSSSYEKPRAASVAEPLKGFSAALESIGIPASEVEVHLSFRGLAAPKVQVAGVCYLVGKQ